MINCKFLSIRESAKVQCVSQIAPSQSLSWEKQNFFPASLPIAKISHPCFTISIRLVKLCKNISTQF